MANSRSGLKRRNKDLQETYVKKQKLTDLTELKKTEEKAIKRLLENRLTILYEEINTMPKEVLKEELGFAVKLARCLPK
jgi:hypothetical protein